MRRRRWIGAVAMVGAVAMTTPAGAGASGTDPVAPSAAGQIGAQIVDGIVSPDPLPSMAALVPDADPELALCGGTLVASTWVLTAAHCVDDAVFEFLGFDSVSDLDVVIGEPDLGNPGVGEQVDVAARYIHPFYDATTLENDVALLGLDGAAAAPVQRLVTLDEDALWSPGTDARVFGYGLTVAGDPDSGSAELREATVPIISDPACALAYEDTVSAIAGDVMFCAGTSGDGLDPEPDSCQGDSGGPIVVDDPEGGTVQIGIVSWGEGCGVYPGVYAEVAALRAWIDATIAGTEFLEMEITIEPAEGKVDTVVHTTATDCESDGAVLFATAGGTVLESGELADREGDVVVPDVAAGSYLVVVSCLDADAIVLIGGATFTVVGEPPPAAPARAVEATPTFAG